MGGGAILAPATLAKHTHWEPEMSDGNILNRLYYQALALFIGVLLVSLGVAVAVTSAHQRDVMLGEAEGEIVRETRLMRRNVEDMLARRESYRVKEAMRAWGATDNDIAYITLSLRGRTVAEFHRPARAEKLIRHNEAIRAPGGDYVFSVAKDVAPLERKLSGLRWRLIEGTALFALAFGALLWGALRRKAMAPMEAEINRRMLVESELTERRRELEILVRERTRDLHLAAEVFENSIEGILITNARGVIEKVNRAFTRITGYTEAEALGKNPRLLKSGRHGEVFYRALWETLLDRGFWEGEIWNRAKDGTVYPEYLTISRVAGERGETTHYIAVFNDISELKRKEEKIRQQAYYDTLTGLPNRTLFEERLGHAIALARSHGAGVAVLLLDLDGFKRVNDSLGHDYGDIMIQEAGRRLTALLGEAVTVARLGGDEFGVIMEDAHNPGQVAQAASSIAGSLALPFALRGREVFVTVSRGATLSPADGAGAATLIKNADMAMYRAKDRGRNQLALFTQAMNLQVTRRLELEGKMRRALLNREFTVYYQPKISLRTGTVVGMEALARWRTGNGMVASPTEFIPLAEESGLIGELGEFVLRESCRTAKEWSGRGLPDLRVAVNVSAAQFAQASLPDRIHGILEQTGLHPSQLELEVTESMVMKDINFASAALARLKGMGVTLALDDFGTGYSSLAYFKALPIDVLKIDKSFVRGVPENLDDSAVAQMIVAMARSLNKKLVVEGIENTDQLEYFRYLKAEEAQGFLFSAPVPAEEFWYTVERINDGIMAQAEIPAQ